MRTEARIQVLRPKVVLNVVETEHPFRELGRLSLLAHRVRLTVLGRLLATACRPSLLLLLELQSGVRRCVSGWKMSVRVVRCGSIVCAETSGTHLAGRRPRRVRSGRPGQAR